MDSLLKPWAAHTYPKFMEVPPPPPPLVYTMLKLPSFEICSEKQFLQL